MPAENLGFPTGVCPRCKSVDRRYASVFYQNTHAPCLTRLAQCKTCGKVERFANLEQRVPVPARLVHQPKLPWALIRRYNPFSAN